MYKCGDAVARYRSNFRTVPAVLFATLTVATMSPALAAEPTFFPPATPARPVVETLHGVTLTDSYRSAHSGPV